MKTFYVRRQRRQTILQHFEQKICLFLKKVKHAKFDGRFKSSFKLSSQISH